MPLVIPVSGASVKKCVIPGGQGMKKAPADLPQVLYFNPFCLRKGSGPGWA